MARPPSRAPRPAPHKLLPPVSRAGARPICSFRHRPRRSNSPDSIRCWHDMAATQLSGYRLMWIFVMFDLPVMTREQARAATQFREFLLAEGFEKRQFSVYARFCNGKEQVEAYMRRIERTEGRRVGKEWLKT